MYNIKSFNINNLISDTNHFVNRLLAVEEQWLNQNQCTSPIEVQEIYRRSCQKFAIENKWILMIDPDENALDILVKSGDVDVNKILKINTSKVAMTIEKIEQTLLRGNCAAIILPDQTSVQLTSDHTHFTKSASSKRPFSRNELERLEKCALRGRTQCILFSKPALH